MSMLVSAAPSSASLDKSAESQEHLALPVGGNAAASSDSRTPQVRFHPLELFLRIFDVEEWPIPRDCLEPGELIFEPDTRRVTFQSSDETHPPIGFTFPEAWTSEFIARFSPAFQTLRHACMEKNPEALAYHRTLRALFHVIDAQDDFMKLENPPFSPPYFVRNIVDWSAHIVDLCETINLLPDHFLLTLDARFPEWVQATYKRKFVLADGAGLLTSEHVVMLLRSLNGLATKVPATISNLFSRFTDDALAQWMPPLPDNPEEVMGEHGVLPLAPEDQLTLAREQHRKLLLPIYQILMASYSSSADLLALIFQDRAVTEDHSMVTYVHQQKLPMQDDFTLQMANVDILKAYVGPMMDVHYNHFLSDAHKDDPDFTLMYQNFISRLLRDANTQLSLCLGHPSLWTKPELNLPSDELGECLTLKAIFIRDEWYPLLEVTVPWFQGIATALQDRLNGLIVPDDLTPEMQSTFRDQFSSLKTDVLDAHKEKQKWEEASKGVHRAYDRIIAQRKELGLPDLPAYPEPLEQGAIAPLSFGSPATPTPEDLPIDR